MAPGYRNQNRRQNRTGYADHDVFEGLPVRHWRRDYVMVAPPAAQENNSSQNDIWAVELPHGMPKDSHLLPQHSQDLLRAARSGRIYKRPAPAEEEEVDPEAALGDKPEKKDDEGKDRGFTAKAWKLIPRHLEGPDEEHLAKRRKGLVTYVPKPPQAEATLTKATVRRTDAAGNEYIQDVVVPHGQRIEGEVIAQTVVADPNSVSAVDPYAAQATSSKRKSSKKKSKSSSKGRKRKSAAPTSAPEPMQIDGEAPNDAVTTESMGPEGIKTEAETETSNIPADTQDIEMAEGSNVASDDDDGEDGEDGDDGEEGEDEEGSVETQNSPSKAPKPSPPVSHTTTPSIKGTPELSPPPSIGGPGLPFTARLEREKSEGKAGSPLKIVASATSTVASPTASPTVSAPATAPETAPSQPDTTEIPKPEIPSPDVVMQEEIPASDLADIPPPPPEPTLAEEKAAVEVRKEEEEEESILLNIAENAGNSNIGAEPPADPEPSPPPPAIDPPVADILDTVAEPAPAESTEPETALEQTTDAAGDDDGFPDLLGGLEKSLNQHPPAEGGADAEAKEAATTDISDVAKPADAADTADDKPTANEDPATEENTTATEAPEAPEAPATEALATEAPTTEAPTTEADQTANEPPAGTEG